MINIIGFILMIITISVPFTIAYLGDYLTEKSGVMNLSIEGMFLNGAFFAYLFTYYSGSLWLGFLGGILGGVMIALIFGIAIFYFNTNHAVTSVGINFLVIGLTGSIWALLVEKNEIVALKIDKIKNIFDFNVGKYEIEISIYFFIFIAILILVVLLFKGKLGLVIHSLGENPKVLDNNYYNVNVLGFVILIIASAIIGIGGSALTLYEYGSFTENITAGNGYIIFICIVFGRFRIFLGLLGVYIFAIGEYLSTYLQISNINIFNYIGGENFALMLPYILVLLSLLFKRGSYTPTNWSKPYLEN